MKNKYDQIVLVEIQKTTQSFFYNLPKVLANDVFSSDSILGAVVSVPLGQSVRIGLIVKLVPDQQAFCNEVEFELKNVSEVLFVPGRGFYKFAQTLSILYQTSLVSFYKEVFKLLVVGKKNTKTIKKRSKISESKTTKTPSNIFKVDCLKTRVQKTIFDLKQQRKLLPEQVQAFEKINWVVQEKSGFAPILFHGKTGSGKTEVYKKLIEQALSKNQSVFWLFPQVWHCQSAFGALQSWFDRAKIKAYQFHSSCPKASVESLAKEVFQGAGPVLIMGVLLPIFVPMANVGLIIVDEEHESSYQCQNQPMVNVKHAAVLLAKCLGIGIILGSATPSIDSFSKVVAGKMDLVSIGQRVFNCKVEFKSVLLNKGERESFWVTDQLSSLLANRLELGQQSVLFLNRRGYNKLAQCAACQRPVLCKNCSCALTIHYKTISGAYGMCHKCDFRSQIGSNCNKCGALLDFKGVGTKQIVQILEKMFPKAKVERLDGDTRKTPEKIQALENCDMIVGTQAIAQSMDLQRVSLVAFLCLDLDFSMPFFNSTEVAVQRMLQLSGRNRGKIPGMVLAQTFDQFHFGLEVNEDNYFDFCSQELEVRKMLELPPAFKRYNIKIKAKGELKVKKMAKKIEALLGLFNLDNNCQRIMFYQGPLMRVAKQFVQDIFLTGQNYNQIIKFINFSDLKVLTKEFKVSLFFGPVF